MFSDELLYICMPVACSFSDALSFSVCSSAGLIEDFQTAKRKGRIRVILPFPIPNYVCVPQSYPTWLPGFTLPSTEVTLSVPSKFTAERIMPWLSMPIILRGAKLATKSTSLPMSCSGS